MGNADKTTLHCYAELMISWENLFFWFGMLARMCAHVLHMLKNRKLSLIFSADCRTLGMNFKNL